MYDEKNELVHISTGKKFENIEKSDKSEEKLLLSSAGFVKWIADGLVEPVSGGILMREPLIKETVSVKDNGRQGVLSQKYDLFFALNWVRNLASAVVSVYSGKTYLFNQSGVDVTVNPFASSITEKGVANTVTFVENSGYTAGHGKCDRPCRAFVRPVEKAGRFSEKTGERGRKQPERDGPEHCRRDRHGGK